MFHDEVTMQMPVMVDAGIAPLLRELWRLGAITEWSCQGDDEPDGEGYIAFRHWGDSPTALDVARLLGIDAVAYTYNLGDYDPPSPYTYLAEMPGEGLYASVLRFPASHLADLIRRAKDAEPPEGR